MCFGAIVQGMTIEEREKGCALREGTAILPIWMPSSIN
jgi:hypothetical protein